jgi:two-component system, NtrC family, sensor kinase
MARSSKTGGKRKSAAPTRKARPAKGHIAAKRPIRPTTRLKRSAAANDELKEAREQQAATAGILKVIASSPSDVRPVFEEIVASANRLIGGFSTAVLLVIEDTVQLQAYTRVSPEADRAFEAAFPLRRSEMPSVAMVENGDTVQVADTETTGDAQQRRLGGVLGWRSVTMTPLMNRGAFIGFIACTRRETGVLPDHHVQLLRTFADQAVIAIENARLFNETREALARQTATSDVLKIISRSSVELEMVLDTLVQAVARLCRADQVYMFHLRHDLWHLIADYGLSAEASAFFQTHPFTPGRGSTSGRAAMEGRAVSITDVLHDPEYTLSEGQAIAGYRSTLGVPLFRENTLIGVFSIVRTRVDPFTKKEIELASTFADQAVIAIENARLFEELRERQAELRVTFDNMGDGVAMFGADKRLASWNRNLQEMLDLADPFLISRPSFAELFRYLAARGEFDSTDLEAELSRSLDDTGREMRYERTRPDGRVIEVRRNPVPDGGFVLIYADITERKRAEERIRIARDAAEKALRDLQAAQDRLVQTEKLASLGQLTAGIAHEIKNPLNFVNNFAALSAELIDEMTELFENTALDERNRREELDEIRKLLKGNLEKVVQHGKRADSIVKNMLLHSREGSGERRSAEINRLVEESLNLAYHGARAEKPGFSIMLKQDLDPEVGALDVYPQEMTRALLNLISNGFYAATRRKAEADGEFEPVLSAVTKKLGDTIEIRIRDNGTGIPPEVRERMFNPFFTTKPTGEGTGLGLSMTHDIIVKQHGGRINVETEQGAFTEFIVSLPRGNSTTR